MAEFLRFAEDAAAQDLRVFVERVQRAGGGAVRLCVPAPGVLAVYAGVLFPLLLGDGMPTVLGMRAVRLASVTQRVDAVVESRAVLERLARVSSGQGPSGLAVPPAETTVAWAGVLPPVAGWEAAGAVTAASLGQVAQDGVERVQELLPHSPGEAVAHRVRAAVWGAEMLPGVPAGVAFVADALGFLRGLSQDASLKLSRSRAWVRLSTPAGFVVARS